MVSTGSNPVLSTRNKNMVFFILSLIVYFISIVWLIWLFRYLTKIGVKGYEKQMLAFYIPIVNTLGMLFSWVKLLLEILDKLNKNISGKE